MLEKKTVKGILVVCDNNYGYRVWFPYMKMLIRSRDVIYDEITFSNPELAFLSKLVK